MLTLGFAKSIVCPGGGIRSVHVGKLVRRTAIIVLWVLHLNLEQKHRHLHILQEVRNKQTLL